MQNPIIDIRGRSTIISVLDYAASYGRLDIYQNVSSTMKNVNPMAASGATPLYRAAQRGQLDIN